MGRRGMVKSLQQRHLPNQGQEVFAAGEDTVMAFLDPLAWDLEAEAILTLEELGRPIHHWVPFLHLAQFREMYMGMRECFH